MARSPGLLRRNTMRSEWAAPLLETEHRPICQVLYDVGSEDHEVHDNARYIMAAWAACDCIPTEALEAGVVRDLLEALEAAAPILQRFLSAGPATVQVDERQALRMAQAALRKARGEEVG